MILEDKIQEELLKELKSNSFNNISILTICKNLNITRQAFYYHYESIFDVIFSIYLNNPIDNNISNLNELYSSIIDYLSKELEFNKIVYFSDSKEVLIEFITSYINKFLLKYLIKFKIDNENIKSISRMYSIGLSNELLFNYFNDYNNELLINKMNLLFNDSIIKTFKK